MGSSVSSNKPTFPLQGNPAHVNLLRKEGSEEQWQIVVTRAYLASGKDMERHSYYQRCRIQLDAAFSKRSRKFWVLVPDSDRDTVPLCSCETNVNDVAYSPRGHVGPPFIKQAIAVTPLFTSCGLRSKGYATELLNRLANHLLVSSTESGHVAADTDVVYIFGHSTVGNLYGALRAKEFGSLEVHLKVSVDSSDDNESETDRARGSELASSDAGVDDDYPAQVVKKDDILALVELDRQAILTEMDTKDEGDQAQARFTVLPYPDMVLWRVEIERFSFNFRVLKGYSPDTWGVVIGDIQTAGPGECPPFCVWAAHASFKCLKILRIRFETREQLRVLVEVARREARRLGMERISIWNLDNSFFRPEEVLDTDTGYEAKSPWGGCSLMAVMMLNCCTTRTT